MLLTRRLGGALGAVVLGAGLAAGPLVPTAASYAAAGPDCTDSGSGGAVTGANTPYDELGIGPAQARLPAGPASAGKGVDVFVVDDGVGAHLAHDSATGGQVQDDHGTTAAGIVGGGDASVGRKQVPVGYAPGVRIHDVRAYDVPWSGSGSAQGATPSPQLLVGALRQVGREMRGVRHAIVLVPFVVDSTPALDKAVDALSSALVIAPTGDRPTAAGQPGVARFYPGDNSDSTPPPGQDAAGSVGPADDDAVLGVGVASWSFGNDPAGPLPNSDVDVAAPVGGGISYDRDGKACVVTTPSADWAASEVAGVAALTWSAWPHLAADQLRTRLELTADGGGIREGDTEGYGVVQPLAAVTVPAAALRAGGTTPAAPRRATAPDPPADVLAGTRHTAVWWGLLGGGALVVALLLRPLLSRRRR
ncbi:MAG: S8/S53 family peptidase [Nocardioidaceae bacterium]|nr:S8/S53 family peptidase [Nocardioidaceae bacterium]MCL2613226.1 S8/S53 family peptidase [Nocardioidaceae bacterium]